MTRAALSLAFLLLAAIPARAQDMAGATYRLRGANVSSGFVAAATSPTHRLRLTAGNPDPPGFAASLSQLRGAALGFLATLAGGFGPADADGDGVPTLADDCPFAPDPAQADFDADHAGDACDFDDDNDSLTDAEEQELGSGTTSLDSDGDGLSDAVEVLVRGSNPASADSDGDGRPDATDNCIAVPNNVSGFGDSDGDGLGDACDPDAAGKRFWTFESGLVRPLAVTPDGTRLLATNAPDDRLEIFDITLTGLSHVASVPVGLEPVAVSARSNGEAWVVNQLSDSVSIVSLSNPPQVVRTLLVGDEPRDVVFGGPGGSRAFVTAAHRGQNSPFPRSDYDVAGVGRADVWVFDANSLGASLGGAPLKVLTLFGDKPRALAVSADGSRVYAAVMNSGNRTAGVAEPAVCDGGVTAASCTVGGASYPGGLPAPNDNHEGFPAPETGLIVKLDPLSGQWRDGLGRNWSNAVRFDLPDLDVFEIDANANPPRELSAFAGVGTTIFNLVTNPVTGAIYASNTDARNDIRFEGHGFYSSLFTPAGQPASLRGHLHEARVTLIQNGVVTPRHLNKHIPYGVSPVPAGVKAASLATPVGMAISPDGAKLYVAAFGSSKIGVFNTAQLASDTFTPSAASQFAVAGGGPAGLALANGRLYTLTRFSNDVVALDAVSGAELDRRALHSPEPASVRDGRRFLYDAVTTSSNGEASCSSCHMFGDQDDLAWDLGNPDGDRVTNQNVFPFQPGFVGAFHPNKGPMTTQTLRGLAHNGPMHWRGDRTGIECQALFSPTCERAAFKAFAVAFEGLLGRDEGPLSPGEMDAFASFVLEVTLPPNPIRQLDNSLRDAASPAPSEIRGQLRYTGSGTDGPLGCNSCHFLAPAQSQFGTGGFSTLEGETQEFKVPQLRNAYQKIGMFGMPSLPPSLPGTNQYRGPQVRGFGFLHDGVVDTLDDFLSASAFTLSAQDQKDIEAFILAFDSDLAPIVGQQVTLSPASGADSLARVSLLSARAQVVMPRAQTPLARECDLVVTGVVQGDPRGWLQEPSGKLRSDGGDPPVSLAVLEAIAQVEGEPLTFTCAPPGSGSRIALDRDEDGVANFVESALLGTDPLQADSDGDGTPDGAEDTDGDRIPDARDDCPFAPNIAQLDRGGVGDSSPPDRIGDACQCGDLDGDGSVETADADLLEAHLADPVGVPLGAGAVSRCRVDAASSACDSVQLASLRAVLAGAPAARVTQVCAAALP